MRSNRVRKLTVVGMLSAVAFILMFLQFSVPLVPGFLKMDVSDMPALIGAFALGPVSGIAICLIKNLLHLLITQTGGVGELSNFILGVFFVLPPAFLYKVRRNKKNAVIGSVLGAVSMGLASICTNYLLVYPAYYVIMNPEDPAQGKEVILELYRLLNPHVHTIMDALVWFNLPFTFVKGMLCVVITLLVYKHLSPILKGN